MRKRSINELGLALGCVIYDMLMLLIALSVHRRRTEYPCYDGLAWGEPQIAIEVILLKCRSLMDFLSPRTPYGDITIKDFECPGIVIPEELRRFRASINKWSAHLSWQRVLQASQVAPQPIQATLEPNARLLLTQTRAVVSECLVRVPLVEDRHHAFWRVFEREFARLC